MLSSRRPILEDETNCGLRHYPSTPHLDTFRSPNLGVNNYMNKDNKPLSTFSTFANNHHKHNKSGADLRYRDDPNPYKVSTIEEYHTSTDQIQNGQESYTIKSSNQLNKSNNQNILAFYTDEEDILRSTVNAARRTSSDHSSNKFYQSSEASNNSGSGGYEIPDPDYEGSTGDSSEDLPLPISSPPICDSSEEYSQLSLSATSTSGGPSPSPALETVSPTKITENDRLKVESALRGRKTWIFVSDSLANLYYMSKSSTNPSRPNSSGSSSLNGDSGNSEWILKYTGVPVLLLDTGETKSRDKRKIQIVLAELGSGLALWKDVIDNLTSYKVVETGCSENGQVSVSTFHTMHMSSDHTRVMGLSFDNPDTAQIFAHKVDKLTSDFANISLSGSKSKKKDGKNKDSKIKSPIKYIRPKKSEISQPCGFQHISSLSPKDKNLFSSLQHFVSPKSGSTSPAVSDFSF